MALLTPAPWNSVRGAHSCLASLVTAGLGDKADAVPDPCGHSIAPGCPGPQPL